MFHKHFSPTFWKVCGSVLCNYGMDGFLATTSSICDILNVWYFFFTLASAPLPCDSQHQQALFKTLLFLMYTYTFKWTHLSSAIATTEIVLCTNWKCITAVIRGWIPTVAFGGIRQWKSSFRLDLHMLRSSRKQNTEINLVGGEGTCTTENSTSKYISQTEWMIHLMVWTSFIPTVLSLDLLAESWAPTLYSSPFPKWTLPFWMD